MTRAVPAASEASDDRGGGRSEQKRRAILSAATAVFLKGGYLGTNMDEIAALSGVSKQTVYKHFGSKEGLFVEIVSSMTNHAGDLVHNDFPKLQDREDLARFLFDYGYRQLSIVVTPHLMQLRRLVIGEVARFPDLARVLYERGPARAMRSLARTFEDLSARNLLMFEDSMMAASHFNWLVMSEPLNRAMLLGDDAIPNDAELQRCVREGVRVFLAAYGKA